MNNDHKSPRQYSDQIHCSHCGKQWDVNDPEPPTCTVVVSKPVDHIGNLRNIINTKELKR